jgi:ATP-dependent helicase/nuclease subunit B
MVRYCDLRARATAFVEEFRQRGPVLVLAPTLLAADEVARAACTRALLDVHRFAFREFVAELSASELLRREIVPVGRFAREAIAARIVAVALDRGELTYLAPVARFPGFPRALARTLEELRLNFVDLMELSRCGDSGPDLGLLLTEYSAELSKRKLADHAARVGFAREAILSKNGRFSQMAVVALDARPRTRMESQLFNGILESARASLELRLDDEDSRQPTSSLETLQRYLFSSDSVPAHEEDGSVEIFSTSGEALECTEIARRIGMAAEAGVPFDEIGILLRSPERHQPLVVEALRRAGIPHFCAPGSARPDIAGRSFLALLYCADERLSASRFAEYLSLGQIPEADGLQTPAVWERLLVDAAVVGGSDRWQKRLSGMREELVLRYEREEEEQARSILRRRIVSVEGLSEIALPMIERLAALPQSATWGEWAKELVELAASTLRDPGRVVDLIEELEPMADIGPVGLAEVLLVLGPQLKSLLTPPGDSRYGKTWVSGIEEARGLAFRQVFVPGLNEGLFPRPHTEDPLLLDAQCDELGISARPDDAELLQIAAATASEKLSTSFSRLDLLTGRERVPSFYSFEVQRAAGGREFDVREFERRASAATRTRIGWPAPQDAADALDDAEFDLATLAPMTSGSGQYLKYVPGRAVASLRARWARWHKPWKAADGLVIEEIGSKVLDAYSLSERPWSPSLLQQYARCPYRFALRGIHGLRPAELPSGVQRIDAATRGRIYHEAQFEILRELSVGGLLPTTPANLEASLDLLDAVLQWVTGRAEAELAPAIPQIWQSGIRSIRADLRGWLQQRASFESDWTPEFYELSFGLNNLEGRHARSQKDPVRLGNGVLLKGSIDLIERHVTGMVRVVDHKTGRIPEPRPEYLGGGEVLQPILYGLAAEKILGEPISLGRLSYATIAQNYSVIDVPLNEWLRKRGEQVLLGIDKAVRDGFLPAAPRKDGCKRCEYLPVCGPYEEERVRAKSQVELKSLKDLRESR